MIVVVLICELVKRTTLSLSSNRWSCSVYRLLGSGVHVRTYVCKYTYHNYNFSPSAPSTSALILCNGACSIHCTSTCTVRLLLYRNLVLFRTLFNFVRCRPYEN